MTDFPDYEQLPREEALRRLYALIDMLGLVRASQLKPTTEFERHRAEFGHALRFGCCREVGTTSPWDPDPSA